MSVINLQRVKDDLRLTHDDDDSLLQILLDASEDEAVRFMNRSQLPTLPLLYPEESSSEEVPSISDPIAPSIYAAVFLLVRSMYDAEKAEEIAKLRQCAEILMQPYRAEMGV